MLLWRKTLVRDRYKCGKYLSIYYKGNRYPKCIKSTYKQKVKKERAKGGEQPIYRPVRGNEHVKRILSMVIIKEMSIKLYLFISRQHCVRRGKTGNTAELWMGGCVSRFSKKTSLVAKSIRV